MSSLLTIHTAPSLSSTPHHHPPSTPKFTTHLSSSQHPHHHLVIAQLHNHLIVAFISSATTTATKTPSSTNSTVLTPSAQLLRCPKLSLHPLQCPDASSSAYTRQTPSLVAAALEHHHPPLSPAVVLPANTAPTPLPPPLQLSSPTTLFRPITTSSTPSFPNLPNHLSAVRQLSSAIIRAAATPEPPPAAPPSPYSSPAIAPLAAPQLQSAPSLLELRTLATALFELSVEPSTRSTTLLNRYDVVASSVCSYPRTVMTYRSTNPEARSRYSLDLSVNS